MLPANRFTVADITAMASLVLSPTSPGSTFPDSCGHLKAWLARVAARPSAAAT